MTLFSVFRQKVGTAQLCMAPCNDQVSMLHKFSVSQFKLCSDKLGCLNTADFSDLVLSSQVGHLGQS
jgi:hypothetical protein